MSKGRVFDVASALLWLLICVAITAVAVVGETTEKVEFPGRDWKYAETLHTPDEFFHFVRPAGPTTSLAIIFLSESDDIACPSCKHEEHSLTYLVDNNWRRVNMDDGRMRTVVKEFIKRSPLVPEKFTLRWPSLLVFREGVLRVVELLEESPRDAGYSTRYDTKKPGMEELLDVGSLQKWMDKLDLTFREIEDKQNRHLIKVPLLAVLNEDDDHARDVLYQVGSVLSTEYATALTYWDVVTDSSMNITFVGRGSPWIRVFDIFTGRPVDVNLPQKKDGSADFEVNAVIRSIQDAALQTMLPLNAGWVPELFSGTVPTLIPVVLKYSFQDMEETVRLFHRTLFSGENSLGRSVRVAFGDLKRDTRALQKLFRRHLPREKAPNKLFAFHNGKRYVVEFGESEDREAIIRHFVRNILNGDVVQDLSSEKPLQLPVPNADGHPSFKAYAAQRDNFDSLVQNGFGVDNLVYFFSFSCIHCHRLNPLLQKVADAFKHDRKIWFPRYNIGFNDAPATLPDVEAPALVLFPHGFPPVSFPLKKYPFDDSIVAPIIAFIQEHRSTEEELDEVAVAAERAGKANEEL